MDQQSVDVANRSQDQNIYLYFTQPEDANIPDKEESIFISPNTSEKISVKGGAMNMFVFSEGNEVLWKGIVPTKIEKTIDIFPEDRKVEYEGVVLPDNFQPYTNVQNRESKPRSIENNKPKDNFWTYFIVSLLIVLIAIGFLWKGGYLSFKKK